MLADSLTFWSVGNDSPTIRIHVIKALAAVFVLLFTYEVGQTG